MRWQDTFTSIRLDVALNPGSSGPVVDAKGRLVGISNAMIRGANIGFAIAGPELMAAFGGRAGDFRVSAAIEAILRSKLFRYHRGRVETSGS